MARIGLMGCGVVAGYGHLPAMVGDKGLELAAVFEPSAERRAWFSQHYPGIPACATLDEFFSRKLDAVAVTSPAPCHHDNVIAAVAAGCQVLCEKPLAMNTAEVVAMADAAERAGRRLFTAFVYRYGQPAREIRRLLRENIIGEVRALRLIYNWHCHGAESVGADGVRSRNARRDGRMREGGPLVDCGTHQIDLARWWLGREVVSAVGHGAWVDEQKYPDHVWLHLGHAGGAATMVEMSYAYGHTAAEPRPDFRYELIGTGGVIRYDHDGDLFEVRHRGGTLNLPFVREVKDFAGVYRDFARFLSHGETGDLGSVQDGLAAMRLSREATEAVVVGRGREAVRVGRNTG